MRCLIAIALCISSTFAYDLNSFSSQYVKAVHSSAPTVRLHVGPSSELRSKREARIHPLDDPNDCILNCTGAMQDRLQGLNDTDSEEAKATRLCKAMEPVESCYKACPESQFRTLMIDFLPLMKQPCLLGTDNYAELQKTLNCLNTSSDVVDEKCDSVCNSTFGDSTRLESNVVLNVDPSFIMYDDDKKENTEVLRETCKYLTCESTCGDSITKEMCGQMGLDVDRKITSSIFGSIIKLYKDLDALDGDVQECKSIV